MSGKWCLHKFSGDSESGCSGRTAGRGDIQGAKAARMVVLIFHKLETAWPRASDLCTHSLVSAFLCGRWLL